MQYLKILGTAQDGGYPHPGCFRDCCKKAWENSQKRRLVSSIAIVDDLLKKIWLLDISPDINEQLHMIGQDYTIEGIFLTHAHYGHYSGIYQLGLEVMNLKNIPVYAMSLMENFLTNNASINFLIKSENILINRITENNEIFLNSNISVSSFIVPHRNEMSETVGYRIKSSNKTIIYLPDIDSWKEWKYDILRLIKDNDILFLDGTFYSKKEIKSRNVKKIPHPSIEESIENFDKLELIDKNKIFFTHLNHTNILLDKSSTEYKKVIDLGYNVAEDGQEVFF